MENSPKIYLIKDLARLSGHSIHTIKFYLKLGLIRESGRSPETRFRYFNDSTLAQLSEIRSWRKQHRSLAQISQLLASSHNGIRAFAQASGQLASPPQQSQEAGRGAQSPEPRARPFP